MELKEAIERLTEVRDRHAKNVKMLEESKVYLKNTAFEEVLIERKKDIEVIDTILNELDNSVSKYYINSLLNKYTRVRKYQKENQSPRHSAVKVKGKIEVLKEILKHEEVE